MQVGGGGLDSKAWDGLQTAWEVGVGVSSSSNAITTQVASCDPERGPPGSGDMEQNRLRPVEQVGISGGPRTVAPTLPALP